MKRQRILTSIILSSILGMGFYTAPAFAETAAGITVGKIDPADATQATTVETLSSTDKIPDPLYGTTYTNQTSYNALTISGLTSENPLGSFTAGGYLNSTGSGTAATGANNNTVTITNTAMLNEGEYQTYNQDIKVTYEHSSIYGGYVTGSTQDTPLSANGNTVTITRNDRKDDVFMGSVVGGYTAAGEASGNTVKLTGVYIPENDNGDYGYNNIFAGYNDDTFVAGGQTDSGNAHDNHVTLTNADVVTVYGGKTNSGNAYNNHVSLTNADVVTVYGGAVTYGTEGSEAALPTDDNIETTTVNVADLLAGNLVQSNSLSEDYMTLEVGSLTGESSSAESTGTTTALPQLDVSANNNTVSVENLRAAQIILDDSPSIYGGYVSLTIDDSESSSTSGIPTTDQVAALANTALAANTAANTLDTAAGANSNTVTIKQTTGLDDTYDPDKLGQGTAVFGGYVEVDGTVSAPLSASRNQVTLTHTPQTEGGAIVLGRYLAVTGGYTTYGDANANKVSLAGQVITLGDETSPNLWVSGSVVGGMTEEGSANANSVTLSVAETSGLVAGGLAVGTPLLTGNAVALTKDDSDALTGVAVNGAVSADYNTVSVTSANTADVYGGLLDEDPNVIIDSGNYSQSNIVVMDTSLPTSLVTEQAAEEEEEADADEAEVDLTAHLTQSTNNNTVSIGGVSSISGNIGGGVVNSTGLAALPMSSILEEVLPYGSFPTTSAVAITQQANTNIVQLEPSVTVTGNVYGGAAANSTVGIGLIGGSNRNQTQQADSNQVGAEKAAITGSIYGGTVGPSATVKLAAEEEEQTAASANSLIAAQDTDFLVTSMVSEENTAAAEAQLKFTTKTASEANGNTVQLTDTNVKAAPAVMEISYPYGLSSRSVLIAAGDVIGGSVIDTSGISSTSIYSPYPSTSYMSVLATNGTNNLPEASLLAEASTAVPDEVMTSQEDQAASHNAVTLVRSNVEGDVYGGLIGAPDVIGSNSTVLQMAVLGDNALFAGSLAAATDTTAMPKLTETSNINQHADDNTVQLRAGAVKNVSIDTSKLTSSSSETITHGGNVYGGKVETYLTTTEMPSLIPVSQFSKVEENATVTGSADRNQVLLEQGAAAAGSIYGGLVDATAYSSSTPSSITNAAYSLNASMLTATDTYYAEALSKKVGLSASQNIVQLSQSTVGSTLSAVNNVFYTYLSVAGDVYGGSVHFNTGNSYIVTDNSTISMAEVQEQTTPTIHITGSSDVVLNVDVKANQVSLDQTTLPGGQVYGGFMGNAISDVRVYPEYEVEMNALSADQTTGNTELLNTSLASSGPFSPSAVDSTVARTTSRTGSVSDNSVWLKNSTVAGKSFSSEDLSAQGVDVDSSVSAIVYGGNVYGGFANWDTSGTLDSSISPTNSPYVVKAATKDETSQKIDEIAATDSSSLLDVQLDSVDGEEAVDQANDAANEAKGSSDTTITLDASRNHVTLLQSAAASVSVPQTGINISLDGSSTSTIDYIRRGGSVYGGYANINLITSAIGSSLSSSPQTIGYTETATANDNQVYLEGSTAGLVLGGYAQSQHAMYVPSAATLTAYETAGGTLPEKITVNTRAEANGNQVVLRDSKVESSVLGGYALSIVNVDASSGTTSLQNLVHPSSTATANQNQVSLSGTTAGHSIAGGITALGSAVENKVTLQQGSKAGAVIGGSVLYQGQADNNSVLLSDSEATTVYGGTAGLNANASALQQLGTDLIFSEGATFGLSTATLAQLLPENANLTASQNTVTISGGTVGSVWGGYAKDVEIPVPTSTSEETLDAEAENAVEVLAASDAEIVNLPYETTTFKSGDASGNTVNYYGGTVTGNIIGGESQSGAANNNIVNLYGTLVGSDVGLYGGVSSVESKGNTLNVYTVGNSVANVGSFQTLNFNVPGNAVAGDTMLLVTGTADVSGAVVQAGVDDAAKLGKGQVINLITNTQGVPAAGTTLSMIPGRDVVTDAGFVQNKVSIWAEDNNKVVVGIPADSVPSLNPDTKLIPEQRVAAVRTIGNGSDVAMDSAYTAAVSAFGAAGKIQDEEKGSFTPYAVLGANHLTIDTGSYVDTNGYAGNLGLVRQVRNANSTDTIIPFAEYGKSSYAAHLDNGARGDGDQHYGGVGLLLRRDLDNGVYYQGNLRVGTMDGDFRGVIAGHYATYDTDARYAAATLGAGRIYKTDDRNSVDVYGRFYYTHLGSDQVKLHSSQGIGAYNLDAVDSYRTRLGARWTHNYWQNQSYYAGLAWDYEFDSTARATYSTFATASPDSKGSSALLELGWKAEPTKANPWGGDVRLMGWAGKQRGVAVNATLTRRL